MTNRKGLSILFLFTFLCSLTAMATVDLGGVATSTPAVASWSQKRLDVFIRGTNNHLWHRMGFDGKWGTWEDLGGDLLYDPAAVSWGENRIDVFAPGLNKHVWHMAWDGKAWSGWGDVGGVVQNGVAAVSWGKNRIDVVARGMNSHLLQLAWTNQGWSSWVDHDGEITSTPGIASIAQNRLDVYARGKDGKLWTKVWNGSTWDDWKSLNMDIPSTPVVIHANDRIELFVLGEKKQVLVQHLASGAPAPGSTPVPKIHTKSNAPDPNDLTAKNPNDATAYNLGVAMGITSYQLSVQPPSDGSFYTIPQVTQDSIKTAADWAAKLKSIYPAIDSETMAGIVVGNNLEQAYAIVVNLRGQYEGVLTKESARLEKVYSFGLQMGVAEGHASGGDAGRKLVTGAMLHALWAANELGIGTDDITLILSKLNYSALDYSKAPINKIYMMITEARGKYSALL